MAVFIILGHILPIYDPPLTNYDIIWQTTNILNLASGISKKQSLKLLKIGGKTSGRTVDTTGFKIQYHSLRKMTICSFTSLHICINSFV